MEQQGQAANASNTASFSADQEPHHSASYPPGAGDTAFITIDNVIFHVDKTLLRYSSRVFETIFEREDTSEQVVPLKIEAEAANFEHILAFIHPTLPSPSLDDIRTLAALFRAAKRYEMEGVLYQLRKSIIEIGLVEDKLSTPWYKRAPLGILIVANAFDCVAESRLALRECLKGRLGDHIVGAAGFDIPAEIIGAIVRLREERMGQLTTKLNSLTSTTTYSCAGCSLQQAHLRFNLFQKLQLHLQPSELKNDVGRPLLCTGGHQRACPVSAAGIDLWTFELMQQEERLPLPSLNPA